MVGPCFEKNPHVRKWLCVRSHDFIFQDFALALCEIVPQNPFHHVQIISACALFLLKLTNQVFCVNDWVLRDNATMSGNQIN